MSLDIGVLLPRDLPADQVLPYARRADELGFAELWVVEDLGFRGGMAQAAAALAVTERIRVGVGILPAGARNVAFAAMEAATVAELFPGRLHLGIGHGMPDWMRQVGAWPASPLTAFEEYVTALRALLRGEEVTVEGRYVRLDGVRLESPPAEVPPVLAGVRGPKSLAAAGRIADGTVLAEPVGPEYLAAAIAQIGHAPGHRLVAYEIAAVDPDPAAARERVRPALAWLGDPGWAPHIEPMDFAAEFRDLRERTPDRAEFAAALPDAWVDRLAVVGTPEQARARLDGLALAGADAVALAPAGPDPLASLEELAAVL
ncbi:LLM class flavin-dependent oxidoreductase [Cellulomonas pakistanensis]|uniref:N5,N10-methylene tetrahydromethanopterin reductase n=1 Tax=Cellulomonas pakistanensis TaxID=992287 RepID=A0A919U483_9CELL|nr:LLM class flavin-dependent oxidoreductase [Cellulomonas pakistanensis]GIG34839.1 N5,N10-methylene tetrahydromethanopterin reductase [Cellulomonas pakistanensis]